MVTKYGATRRLFNRAAMVDSLLQILLFAAFFCGSPLFAREAPVPNDLRQPGEKADAAAEIREQVKPAAVPANRMISDPLQICPPDALWYFASPDMKTASAHWRESPLAHFLGEPRVRQMITNNPFNLVSLFSDLPRSVIILDRVKAVSAGIDLAERLAPLASTVATAGYFDAKGDFSFLLLLDVGSNRVPAFDALTEWEGQLYGQHIGISVKAGDHSGNYIDVWTLPAADGESRSAEIAAGFAENYAFITNDSVRGAAVVDLVSGGDALVASTLGRRFAAAQEFKRGQGSSRGPDATGFVRLGATMSGFTGNPITRAALRSWATLLGGDEENEAFFYGVRLSRERSQETYLVPIGANQGGIPTVPGIVASLLRPAGEWTVSSAFPYQPSPMFFTSSMCDKAGLSRMLRSENGLFNRSVFPSLPDEVRSFLTDAVVDRFTGEIGMAYFSSDQGQGRPQAPPPPAPWLLAFAVDSDVQAYLPRATQMLEKSGITIRSESQDWRAGVCWATIPASTSRRLRGNFLVVASTGDLLGVAIEQILSGATFADSKDFVSALNSAEPNQGLLFYLNTADILVREFSNFSYIMRTIFPRSSGLNSRPPLNLFRRYARGLLGVVAPGDAGGFLRVTVQAPCPSLWALALYTVVDFPRSLRDSGRRAMEKSRDNLTKLWLKLQLFSSRNGHFPADIEELAVDMRNNGMTQDDINSILIAPAADYRIGKEAALKRSYLFVNGIMPNDEPDIPLVYEAEPWTDDFAGRHPSDGSPPRDSGNYISFRQFIQLDGTICTVPESKFQDEVLKRLEERE